MNTKMSIPARIKSLREYQGWSQTELAEKSGVGQSYISRLEDGDAPNVSGVILARIATALQTSTDYLLGRTDNPSPHPTANSPAMKDPLFADIADAWPDLEPKDCRVIWQTVCGFATLRRRERGEGDASA